MAVWACGSLRLFLDINLRFTLELISMDTTYYKLISAKGKKAIAEKKANGEVMHLAPLGWKNTRDRDGRSVIIKDPETYPLVAEAKRLRGEGKSIRVICLLMEEMGLWSTRGKVMGPSSMLKVLHDNRSI